MRPTFCITTDLQKNRIYLDYSTQEQLSPSQLRQRLLSFTRQLLPDWGAIVNITPLSSPLGDTQIAAIEDTITLLRREGLSYLVRIINDINSPYKEQLVQKNITNGNYLGLITHSRDKADYIMDWYQKPTTTNSP